MMTRNQEIHLTIKIVKIRFYFELFPFFIYLVPYPVKFDKWIIIIIICAPGSFVFLWTVTDVSWVQAMVSIKPCLDFKNVFFR